MYKEERQRIISDLISKNSSINVAELAKAFKASPMTIRRDLSELEQQGLLIKTYGGAIATANLSLDGNEHLDDRMKLLAAEKRRIANYIARMIEPSEMIFLGSGTTTTFIAKALSFRTDITVVTNALTVMEELASNANMTLIGIGGFLRRNEYSFYGHFTESILKDLHVNKVIMGIRGIHPSRGLTTDFPQEMQTDRMIMQTSENVIIAADRTKIGYVASSALAPLSAARIIVTTEGVDPILIQQIRNKHVRVEIV